MSLSSPPKIPFIRRPWFAFFSSMRFAVALLSVLAIASVVGTVLQQNQPKQNYVVKFGAFWTEIFEFLGLFDVYASAWFTLIMLFLVLSTSLCLWRNVPPFLREMRSFRTQTTAKSLAHMKHTALLSDNMGSLKTEIAAKYWQVNGFQTRITPREDGSVLLSAKKGAMNKWGYIFAHAAIIVICLGGLVDSNLLLKIGMLTGKIVPDTTSQYARDFQAASRLSAGNLSFRANAEVVEGQTIEAAFINADKGLLLQELPFTLELKKFHIDFYNTGMPKDFASDIVVTDKASGKQVAQTIRVNHPLTINGITIYQSTYGDGGSDVRFQSWDLRGANPPVMLDVVSQRAFPLDLGKEKYQFELGELRVFNVENTAAAETAQHDVRSVAQPKQFQNVGPTIMFKLRDAAGQAHEYVNYMLPLERAGVMALRATLMQPEKRAQIVQTAVANVNENMRSDFKLAVENLLRQFAEGGYIAINEHIQQNVPAEAQQKTGEIMYQILYSSMDVALTQALNDFRLPPMAAGEARNRFILNSMDGYTALTKFQSPVLLQMDTFKQVNMSGLQMTKSPGASLVYIGSVLLVLGTVFMFYVREKRAWLLFFPDGSTRVAMSATRSERELTREFPEHLAKLETLARDLGQAESGGEPSGG